MFLFGEYDVTSRIQSAYLTTLGREVIHTTLLKLTNLSHRNNPSTRRFVPPTWSPWNPNYLAEADSSSFRNLRHLRNKEEQIATPLALLTHKRNYFKPTFR